MLALMLAISLVIVFAKMLAIVLAISLVTLLAAQSFQRILLQNMGLTGGGGG